MMYKLLIYCTLFSIPVTGMTFFKEIYENSSFEFNSYVNYFYKETNNNYDDFESWSKLKLKSNSEITEELLFNFSAFFIVSSRPKELNGIFTVPHSVEGKARMLDFDELNLKYEFETTDLLIGKSNVPAGIAEIFSPSDIFGKSSAANPIHPVNLGVWQLNFNYFFEEDSIGYYLFPFDTITPSTAPNSRWSGNSGDSDFASLSEISANTTINEDHRSSMPKEWGHLLKYNGIGEGIDYFISFFYGASPYPVLEMKDPNSPAQILNPTATKLYPNIFALSAGMGITKGAFRYYFEGNQQITIKKYDDDFLKYSLGIKYRESNFANSIGFDEISPTLEYAGEWVNHKVSNNDIAAKSKNSRPNRNHLSYMLEIKKSSTWTFYLGGSFNIYERENIQSYLIKYNYSDNLFFTLAAHFYAGDSDSLLGRYSDNDNVELGLNYKF